jgi:DNA polymerase-3 subunit alpha
LNQINLFESDPKQDNEIINLCKDWTFDERLSKEFNAVGFYISDHPLNQYKNIFSDYKIIDYNEFNKKNDNVECNIAATLLKIQERKTQKGNSYAIIKLTDLSSVFELFIFSDLLEINRGILKEGDSLILTISKNIVNNDNRFKRTNIKKIASLKEIFNKPISKIEIKTDNILKINEISNFLKDEGSTEVKINIKKKDKEFIFKLKNKRLVDRKSLNTLKNQDIEAIIN